MKNKKREDYGIIKNLTKLVAGIYIAGSSFQVAYGGPVQKPAEVTESQQEGVQKSAPDKLIIKHYDINPKSLPSQSYIPAIPKPILNEPAVIESPVKPNSLEEKVNIPLTKEKIITQPAPVTVQTLTSPAPEPAQQLQQAYAGIIAPTSTPLQAPATPAPTQVIASVPSENQNQTSQYVAQNNSLETLIQKSVSLIPDIPATEIANIGAVYNISKSGNYESGKIRIIKSMTDLIQDSSYVKNLSAGEKDFEGRKDIAFAQGSVEVRNAIEEYCKKEGIECVVELKPFFAYLAQNSEWVQKWKQTDDGAKTSYINGMDITPYITKSLNN
jgi:hypothetical protein